MAQASTQQTRKYDQAAPGWGDKMRLLGYYDAYLGFLTSETARDRGRSGRVIDIGCGTGAMAEAWSAIHGGGDELALLDPSGEMLNAAEAATARRGAITHSHCSDLETFETDRPYDTLLAAHVIEHAEDPVGSLTKMRALATAGARLWLVVSKPHWCNAIIWLQWRHRAYRAEEVRAMLQESGWAVERDYAFPSGPPSRTSRGYLARAV